MAERTGSKQLLQKCDLVAPPGKGWMDVKAARLPAQLQQGLLLVWYLSPSTQAGIGSQLSAVVS